ncbi:hypothetical protein BOTBODRAFT_177331 [Botryobasidium botryosum FD-172 SS1]|uniref:Endonuclease/exonuclease/phosphatase domain-containing protein n=1 Tax=Botryobasidium botryosum (strain FD-172 SS1) TaxID=930990 RepID=A0A067M6V2_BOTB1|nr:hypothetical protein BOTBODRAFT_177331 [Botryobasidium botryosum FD-172 SS1]
MEDQIQRIPTPLYHYDRPLLSFRPGAWQEHPGPTPSVSSSASASKRDKETGSGVNTPLRVLTWNIWFDTRYKAERTHAFIRAVRAADPDVCCLQETTTAFEAILRADAYWRATWVMTALADQTDFTKSHYGTMICVKKSLMKGGRGKGRGFSAQSYIVAFPGTQTGRCLTVLELSPGSKLPNTPPILIGTVHLDYTPQLRASHIAIAIRALSMSSAGGPVAASILCGDTNFTDYSETAPLVQAGFVDAWVVGRYGPNLNAPNVSKASVITDTGAPATAPGSARNANATLSVGDTHPDGTAVDWLLVDPTFGETGVRKRGEGSRESEVVRRLDLIMCRGLRIDACKLAGEDPIPQKALRASGVKEGDDIVVWPSDHKGVCVDVKVVG